MKLRNRELVKMSGCKRVQFNDDPQYFYVPKHDETRQRFWEFYAVDRCRFLDKVKRFAVKIDPILKNVLETIREECEMECN